MVTTRKAGVALGLAAAALVLLLSQPALCGVSVTLSLDRSDATLGDSLRLSVGVSGAQGIDATPAIQGLDDFFVRPAGTSTRVEVVNGQYSAGMEFSYLLQPKKTGTFRIGPAVLTIDGRAYRSEAVQVVVGDRAGSPAGDRGPVFLVAHLAPATVYVEQQALYTLKLYRSVSIRDASVSLPEADGVAFTKLGEPREYQSTLQGRSYQVIELRYLVQPHQAGARTLPEARVDLTVFLPHPRSGRGMFDNPFFGQMASGRPLTVASETLALQVLPLPREGRPAEFSGLVGSFTLEASVEPQALPAGESATLTATVRGRGNVKRIPELKIPPLDGIKVYADQPVQKDETTAEGVSGAKTMKWALVPQKEGRYRIPALTLSYFDTAAGAYKTVRTPEKTLTVSPGSGGAPLSAPAGPVGAPLETATKKAVTQVGRDILPVHDLTAATGGGKTTLPQGPVLWALLAGPPAVFFLTLGGAGFRRRSKVLNRAWRARRAAAGFAQTCRQGRSTAAELLPALQEYLNRRLGLSRGSLTADEAAQILLSRKLDRETVGKLREAWRALADAIYTGRGGETTGEGERLIALVARIEKGLR